jgi:phosphinothricin acetyltransferase
MESRGKGLGRGLYLELENILKAQHFHRLYACIAHTDIEDKYLSHASIHFHERMGYRLVGSFPECAFKFQRWYGMCWMEKRLAGSGIPSDIIPFPDLTSAL